MPDDLSLLTTALADRYRIERELGAGGMATVYLAHDPNTIARSRSRFSGWRMKAGDLDGVFDPRFKALLAKMKIAEDKP